MGSQYQGIARGLERRHVVRNLSAPARPTSGARTSASSTRASDLRQAVPVHRARDEQHDRRRARSTATPSSTRACTTSPWTSNGNTVSHNTVRGTTGIGIEVGGSQNTIGPANVVTDNGTGIAVRAGTGNTVTRNEIDSNLGLGIDLGDDGVTPNDPGSGGLDGDSGPNGLQNFPESLVATVSGGSLHVTGTLPSAAATHYTIELFASDTPEDVGYGEGARYLGSTTVTTDGVAGTASIDATLTPGAGDAAAGDWLAATATAEDGSTSEFSQAVQITTAAAATSVTIAPEADTFVALGAPGTNFGTADYADTFGGHNPACVLANDTSYTLLRFDLSAIPAGSVITGVELDTTTRAGYAQDGDPAHWAIFVPSDSWSETGVTWNTRPCRRADDGRRPGLRGGAGHPRLAAARSAPPTSGAAAAAPTPIPPATRRRRSRAPRTACRGPSRRRRQTSSPASRRSGPATASCRSSSGRRTARSARAAPTSPTGRATSRARRRTRPFARSSCVTFAAVPVGAVQISAATPTVEAGASQVRLSDVPPSVLLSSARSAQLLAARLDPPRLDSARLDSSRLDSSGLDPARVDRPRRRAGAPARIRRALDRAARRRRRAGRPCLPARRSPGLPLQNVTLADRCSENRGRTTGPRARSRSARSTSRAARSARSPRPWSVSARSRSARSRCRRRPTSRRTTRRWSAGARGWPARRSTARPAANLGPTTVIAAALQGAPLGSIPLGSIPLGLDPARLDPARLDPARLDPARLDHRSTASTSSSRRSARSRSARFRSGSIPLGSIPLGSIPLGSIDLAGSPLGSIPLGSIPLGSIHVIFDCTTAARPRGRSATTRRAAEPASTLEQLLRTPTPARSTGSRSPTSSPGRAGDAERLHDRRPDRAACPPGSDATYADLLALLLDPHTLNWEALDLQSIPVQSFASDGSTLDYHVDFTLAPERWAGR